MAAKPDKKAEKQFRELGSAVYEKRKADVERLLAAKVDPDLVPYNMIGDSLLRFAVGNKVPLPIIKLLVEAGAKLDKKNPDKQSAIDAAVEHERKDVIEYFASKGAKVKFVALEDLPQKEKNARLAKVLDSWYDDDCAKRLAPVLKAGADPNAKVDGVTPLQRLLGQGENKKLFQLLLEAGADPKLKDDEGDTPIHVCAQHADTAPVLLFLDAGVPIDFRDAEGNTALHRAGRDGYNGADGTVKALLARGADPLLRNKAGESAIDIATEDCKKLMLKKVGKTLSKDAAALIAAVAANDAKKVAKLLAAGANASEVDTTSGKEYGDSNLDGVAAIHVALARGVDRAIADQILASKVDVDVKTVDGRTPLHIVVQYGRGANRAELVAKLIELGADVNAKNMHGETPIWEATSFYKLDGELELVDQLMAAGADKKIVDNNGESPIDKMHDSSTRFHEVNDKPGFLLMIEKLIKLGFKIGNKKALDAWLAQARVKYGPKKGKEKAQKPAKPSPQRQAFDKITGGKLHSYVDKTTTLELAGKRHPVALFDWFAYVAEQRDDKSDCMMQIAEYHIAGDAVDQVAEAKWIPFGVVGMNGSLDSYREIGVDGTLYLDLSKAKGSDAPVVFATQSYMGLEPADPLSVKSIGYAALMKTLKK